MKNANDIRQTATTGRAGSLLTRMIADDTETGWLFDEAPAAASTRRDAPPVAPSSEAEPKMSGIAFVPPRFAADRAGPIDRAGLTPGQLIDLILERRPGLSADFLDGFGRDDLERYLDRLVAADEPRGPNARWQRLGDTPAIVSRTRPV